VHPVGELANRPLLPIFLARYNIALIWGFTWK
jgi:hypothetical protein